MRVMVIVKASQDSEAGVMPSEQLLADMGKYNEELVKAGIMLAGVNRAAGPAVFQRAGRRAWRRLPADSFDWE